MSWEQDGFTANRMVTEFDTMPAIVRLARQESDAVHRAEWDNKGSAPNLEVSRGRTGGGQLEQVVLDVFLNQLDG